MSYADRQTVEHWTAGRYVQSVGQSVSQRPSSPIHRFVAFERNPGPDDVVADLTAGQRANSHRLALIDRPWPSPDRVAGPRE